MASIKSARGFAARCPWCQDEDETLTVALADVRKITCSACDREFTAEEARARVAEALVAWDKVARWLAMAAEVLAE
jgi:hypothetical protein